MFDTVAYEGVIRTGQMKTECVKFQVCACKRIHGKRFCWIYPVAKSHPPPRHKKRNPRAIKYIKPRKKTTNNYSFTNANYELDQGNIRLSQVKLFYLKDSSFHVIHLNNYTQIYPYYRTEFQRITLEIKLVCLNYFYNCQMDQWQERNNFPKLSSEIYMCFMAHVSTEIKI